MKAVIFAAGEGKRMQPLTFEKPKPMLEVLGKPLIQRTFEAMPESVDEVVVVVGYKQEQIQAFLGSEFLGKRVSYVVQERVSGTADALMLARAALGDGPFFSFYADDIYDRRDVEKLLAHHYGVLVAEVPNPSQFGVVELAADGRLLSFEEKPEQPKSNLISTGAFLLDERIFQYEAPVDPRSGERYIVDMVMAFAQAEPFYGVVCHTWIPVGYPEDIAKAEALLRVR